MNTETTKDNTRIKQKFAFINKSRCKKFALDFAKSNRAQKFTRVGEAFYISCENALRTHMSNRINCHPSKGKTIT